MLVIDSHAHFWKDPPPGVRFGAHHDPIHYDDFIKDMDAAGVDKLVQVTRGVMGFDNAYSIEGASKYPDRIRVLGRIDAGAPDVIQQLRGWLKQPYVVGIRLMTMWPTEAPWWDDGTLEKFWPVAQEERIPISMYCPERSKMVGDIARRHPELPIVVDHVGLRVFNIFESAPGMEDWPNLMALKQFPNVTIKVTGLPEAMVERYPFPKSQERMKEIYEHFGPDRMMWGSNYPPTTVVCNYREAVDLVREGCPFINAADKQKILAGTAIKVFNLPWKT